MNARLRAAATAAALFLVCAAAFAQTAEPSATVALSVDQAIARALSNQPLILQAEAAVAAARARVGQAESAYYPSISAATSYTRVEPDQSLDFASVLPPSFLSLLPPGSSLTFSLFPVDNWDFHVGLNQVIYQFGKRGVQVSLAQSGVSAALIGVDQIRMSLAYQTAVGFYTVLYMRQQLKALGEQTENLQQHLQATKVKAETGAATRYDELATEVRVSVLQSQLIEAQSQLRKQEIGLGQVLGLKDGEQLVLDGDFSSSPIPTADPQSLLSTALSKRQEVRQAVEAENAAELARLARLGMWPTVSAHGSIGYKNGLLPDINSLTFNWLAGVQVSVPIFQGFLVAQQGAEAEKRLMAARDNTAAVKRNVTTQVLQAIQDVQASHEQVQSAQAQLDQTREMLGVVKLQYDLGMLTNLEYLDAQAALERAQIGSLQARYRAVVSRYALEQATGAVIWAPGASDR